MLTRKIAKQFFYALYSKAFILNKLDWVAGQVQKEMEFCENISDVVSERMAELEETVDGAEKPEFSIKAKFSDSDFEEE